MAEKVKQLFLSKNYLVIDSVVDCRLVFNPQGDGTSGGDVLYLRGGRWSFRINDFLAGELLPDGSRENISGNGAGYSVNIVWNDEDGEEPDYYTTYRNPANISALDGQLVQIAGALSVNGLSEISEKVNQSTEFLSYINLAYPTRQYYPQNLPDMRNLVLGQGRAPIKLLKGTVLVMVNNEKIVILQDTVFFFKNTENGDMYGYGKFLDVLGDDISSEVHEFDKVFVSTQNILSIY